MDCKREAADRCRLSQQQNLNKKILKKGKAYGSKNPQFEINIRKNANANNPGYGKYYPKAVEKQTISLRGLCNHMAEHNSIYGRDIIQGVR